MDINDYRKGNHVLLAPDKIITHGVIIYEIIDLENDIAFVTNRVLKGFQNPLKVSVSNLRPLPIDSYFLSLRDFIKHRDHLSQFIFNDFILFYYIDFCKVIYRDEDPIEIDAVHKFQNLVFEKTGEEFIIRL